VRTVSLSVDGRLLATGSYWHGQAKVWERQTGRLLRTLDVGKYCYVRFSPNGKWLATASAGEFQLWDVNSWKPRTIELLSSGSYADYDFSPNDSSIAVLLANSDVHLIDAETGDLLARLRNRPNQSSARRLAYSPDGRHLAVIGTETPFVWDLWDLRQELSTLGLGWPLGKQASRPDASNRSDGSIARAGAVRFHLSDEFKQLESAELVRLAVIAAGANEIGAARLKIQRALELVPQDAETCSRLAWLLATGPITLRDPTTAVRLARRAVDTEPDNQDYLKTLGVTYVRDREYGKAIEILERTLESSPPEHEASCLYFLAMSYVHSDRQDEAVKAVDRADQLRQQNAGTLSREDLEQLDSFAKEAQLLVRPGTIGVVRFPN
jgi:hypothetical protein